MAMTWPFFCTQSKLNEVASIAALRVFPALPRLDLFESTKSFSSFSLSFVLNDLVTTSTMLTKADKFSLSC